VIGSSRVATSWSRYAAVVSGRDSCLVSSRKLPLVPKCMPLLRSRINARFTILSMPNDAVMVLYMTFLSMLLVVLRVLDSLLELEMDTSLLAS